MVLHLRSFRLRNTSFVAFEQDTTGAATTDRTEDDIPPIVAAPGAMQQPCLDETTQSSWDYVRANARAIGRWRSFLMEDSKV